MPDVLADTHALVWYLVEPARLSAAASAALDQAVAAGGTIRVSAVSVVELIYLVEKARLPQAVIDRLRASLADQNAEIKVVPVDEDVAWYVGQVPRSALPDLPDRVIAATALRLNLPLITRDSKIQAAGIATVW
ncbi:MAG: PIN domain-containing protein [Thermoguttaceae bacterium]|jgi:PIN domain nuclease of toxin-antitoxin system